MAIQDYQSLMLPVLTLAAKGETSAPEVEQKIADQLGLTPEERAQLLPSGRQRILHNRVHWAKFYIDRAGLIASPRRGRVVASEEGRALLATKTERVDVQRLLSYPSFREFYKSSQSDSQPSDGMQEPSPATVAVGDAPQATPEERIEAAYATMQSARGPTCSSEF